MGLKKTQNTVLFDRHRIQFQTSIYQSCNLLAKTLRPPCGNPFQIELCFLRELLPIVLGSDVTF